MQTGYIDLVKRLQVARETGHLSRDLAEALLDLLPRMMERDALLAARDGLIRRAADLVPGSTERKAVVLRRLIVGMRGPAEDIIRLLREAARFGELPGSTRQLRRILTSNLL